MASKNKNPRVARSYNYPWIMGHDDKSLLPIVYGGCFGNHNFFRNHVHNMRSQILLLVEINHNLSQLFVLILVTLGSKIWARPDCIDRFEQFHLRHIRGIHAPYINFKINMFKTQKWKTFHVVWKYSWLLWVKI